MPSNVTFHDNKNQQSLSKTKYVCITMHVGTTIIQTTPHQNTTPCLTHAHCHQSLKKFTQELINGVSFLHTLQPCIIWVLLQNQDQLV
jgi:hypothetical protein